MIGAGACGHDVTMAYLEGGVARLVSLEELREQFLGGGAN
jgi:hypothetical protein